MAKVMLSERNGKVQFYVAKKDMEEEITELEFESEEKWGGSVLLSNGDRWYFDPLEPKRLPAEVVAKKMGE